MIYKTIDVCTVENTIVKNYELVGMYLFIMKFKYLTIILKKINLPAKLFLHQLDVLVVIPVLIIPLWFPPSFVSVKDMFPKSPHMNPWQNYL